MTHDHNPQHTNAASDHWSDHGRAPAALLQRVQVEVGPDGAEDDQGA